MALRKLRLIVLGLSLAACIAPPGSVGDHGRSSGGGSSSSGGASGGSSGSASSSGSSSSGGSSGSGSSSSGASSSSGSGSSGGSSSGGCPADSGGTTVSIDAGGPAAGDFRADAYYSGGTTFSTTNAIDTSLLTCGAPPAAVLQTERYGEFTYTIPNRTPGTPQMVTLYFEESHWSAAGKRIFDVAINGSTALTAFDILAAAGGANRAIAKTFTTTADAAGKVTIQFLKTGADNPKVCGLSVAGPGTEPPPPATRPCDLYEAGGTPCVAAHSTVRALYGAYGGHLYQVRRASDGATRDVDPLEPGGFAESGAQDAFCAGTTCTISLLYDQSPQHNHLTVAPGGGTVHTPDREADAARLKVSVGGHPVYAIWVDAGVGYRNNRTSGVATGDQPEGMYMVTSGKHVNGGCCFDYGNAETTSNNDGNGTMEAIYFGTSTEWGRGSGSGPWVMADLENGLFAGGNGVWDANTPVPYDYVTAMVKGKPNGYALKAGDAQSGALKTMYDGARPTVPGYNPMRKQGAILLGIGGDNSNWAVGTFYEGCMTSGYPSDATEDAVQSNIVDAGYGR